MTPAREWMQSHGINMKLAASIGMYAGNGTLFCPYDRENGERFWRERTFPDGYWKQPKGESLCCWWPCGGRSSSFIALAEGEGDTLALASVLCDDNGEPRDFGDDHPLLGLCPVGLPGTAYAKKAALELVNAAVVYVIMDGDEPGQKASDNLVRELFRRQVTAIPVALPQGTDLADYLGWDTDGDSRETVLANLLLDAEAHAQDRREAIEMGDIKAKLGVGAR